MTNHDEELVTKGEAQKAIRNIFNKYTKEMQEWPAGMLLHCSEAIDSLPAVPQGKDCVEREQVKNGIEAITHLGDTDYNRGWNAALHRLLGMFKGLDPAVPASQALPASSEILKKLKAIIEKGAFRSLYQYERTDWNFGYQDACKALLEDLKKLEEAQHEKDTGD